MQQSSFKCVEKKGGDLAGCQDSADVEVLGLNQKFTEDDSVEIEDDYKNHHFTGYPGFKYADKVAVVAGSDDESVSSSSSDSSSSDSSS